MSPNIAMAGLSGPAAYKLFYGGDYSDFAVTCAGRDFKVHRTIVCPESHFFQAISKGNFKVCAQLLARESLIDPRSETVSS